MKIIIVLFISIICGIGADAQTGTRQRTVSGNQSQILFSDTARFEIILLKQPVQLTIKLDRYSGRTYGYVQDGGRRWFPLEVTDGLPNSFLNTLPVYQITGEGEQIFLFNNETGRSWILTNYRIWTPIRD